jgi:hypothetical protein
VEAIRLIMSGAVVGQELAAEFGPLPPSLLPVGVRRLYELQAEALSTAPKGRKKRAGKTWLVLPETFALSPYDQDWLAEAAIQVLQIPAGLTLGEAIVYALNSIGVGDVPLHILHGDTLIASPPLDAQDVIVTAARPNDYSWAEADIDEDGRIRSLATVSAGERGQGRPVIAGYFALGSSLEFLRALTRMRGDFIGALNHYLAVRPVSAQTARDWLDFGHLQTFFQSRLAVTTARGFNNLVVDGVTVRKSSRDKLKMWAEASWYQAVPMELQIYSARLLDVGSDGDVGYYQTQYEYLPVLSELFVFGALGQQSWVRVLSHCEDFLGRCAALRRAEPPDLDLRAFTAGKTAERLQAFARQSGFDIDRPLTYAGRPCPSLAAMAEQLAEATPAERDRPAAIVHGDFCFSNILYDSRTRRIRVIDPRGLIGGKASIYGDLRYDLAKLAHSIVGRYDQIIAGRYRMDAQGTDYSLQFEDNPAQAWLQAGLGDLVVDGSSGLDPAVRAVMAGLFLSMLPLHADRPDRQQAFVANAMRLFLELDR